jgi:hypothetical protein
MGARGLVASRRHHYESSLPPSPLPATGRRRTTRTVDGHHWAPPCDRDLPPRGARFRLDRALLDVPRSLDADDAVGEVDVVPAERLELAAAETAVERRRPQRSVALRERGEEGLGVHS